MKQRCHKVVELAVVLTTIAAWLSISNHCAAGALVVVAKAQSAPRMHCHGSEPSPSKKSSEEQMPCCKVLRATLAGQGKTVQVTSKDFLPIQTWIIAEAISAYEAQLHRPHLEFDTGPPFAASFAESVLQQSLLAHAPPCT